MGSAWVAVIVSGVTVIVNFFAIFRAGAVQNRIARNQRIGDRRIDTYLGLLKWAEGAEEKLGKAQGSLESWEAIELPDELALHTHAFASDAVNQQVDKFQKAWLDLKRVTEERETELREIMAESFRTKNKSLVQRAFPEYQRARTASSELRRIVRAELNPKK